MRTRDGVMGREGKGGGDKRREGEGGGDKRREGGGGGGGCKGVHSLMPDLGCF